MRRSLAILTILIQFCVQLIPLAFAEDAIIVASGSTLETSQDVAAGTGAVLDGFPTASGGTLASSGAMPPAMSGAMLPAGSGAVAASSGAVTASTGAVVAASSGAVVTGSGATVESPSVSSVPSAPVRVVVTEVAWMGSDRSTADEWVEIAAFGSGSAVAPRSLSGWTLVGVKAGVETVLARLGPLEASSGAVFVIANSPAPASRLAVEPSVVTTDVSLPNTQLLLRLKDGSGAIVDEVDDGVGAPFAGANPSGGAKAAMERVDPWTVGTVPSNWKTATLSVGFDDGVPIFGTPGSLGSVRTDASPSGGGSDETPPAILVTPPPALRLTEVLANPPGADTDEWVEIGSFDPAAADLAEWTLKTGTLKYVLAGTLQPGEHRRFGKSATGLPLPNGGGTLELLWRGKVVDTWTYGESAEGVSIGRAPDGSVAHQCVPSPDAPNTAAPLDPWINVQSSTAGPGKLSLNLEARVSAGSLAGAVCSWTYPDGYVSASCNPPSHTLPGPLLGDVFLTLTDYCGNTMIRLLHVDVPGPLQRKEADVIACIPTAFTGVTVSELLPNPAGEDDAEWIELANPTDVPKPLCGWSVDDGERGSTPYRLDHLQLPPGERMAFPRTVTAIALNNDTDAVRLFSPLPGGGSGAYEIVRYGNAPEGRAYARREDGAWLWTDPTPDAPNAFREVRWPDEVSVELVQVLPNPGGNDAQGVEWVELRNRTPYPLPITKWTLSTKQDVVILEGVLAPHERMRFENVIPLANTDGFVRLSDPDGVPVSLLAWGKATDGRAISRPSPTGRATGLSFIGRVDCRTLILAGADGPKEVVLHGVSKIDCSDSFLALLENKKIDQEIYATEGVESLLSLSGTSVVELLLRHGMASVDPLAEHPWARAYAVAEAEARAERRGVWANPERTILLDETRTMEETRERLRKEGLRLTFSHEPGVVASGALLAIRSNVPASILVGFGSGTMETYDGPIALHTDAELRIEAVADVQSASGSLYSYKSIQPFYMLKNRYPKLRISEVYPSPLQGEDEWVELWNPTGERVPLVGWTIDDAERAGSTPMRLTGGVLEPGERMRVTGGIAWNNGGDDARLIAPNGRLAHAVSYGAVKKGNSYSVSFGESGVVLGECVTTRPTPGAENRCATAVAAKKSSVRTSVNRVRAALHAVRYRNLVESPDLADPRPLFEVLFAAAEGIPMAGNAGVAAWLAFAVFLAACGGSVAFREGVEKKREKC